jgi:hypothetical protein
VQDPFDQSSKHLRLQLDLFPLIRFVWIGSLLLVGGAGVSLWPRRQPAAVVATAAEEGGEAARADPPAPPRPRSPPRSLSSA